MSIKESYPLIRYTGVVTAVIGLAALLHIVAAWFNVGNFHPDGHFQILEFANYKLGNIESAVLPWEFHWKIRPAIQPAIAFTVHKLVQFSGIGDQFTVTFILRLMSAGLGLSAALLLGFYALRWTGSPTLRAWLIPACCLFWVLPFLHSSFTSENWSGSLLCLGTVLLLSSCNDDDGRSTWQAFLGGLLLGFSIYFRFPAALALAGLGLWAVFVGCPPKRYVIALSAGFMFAVLINLCLDFWLYGEWVLTPLRYFDSNIIQGRAAEFGVDPWWYYLPKLFAVLVPPWSLVFVPAIVLAMVRHPRNPLVWMFIGFFFFHSVIGHKETRFLIPIINFLPVLVFIGLDSLRGRVREKASRFARSMAGTAAIVLFITLNTVLMLIVSVMPAHQSAVIQDWAITEGRKEPFVLNTYRESPYDQANLVMHYYMSRNVEIRPISSHDELCDRAKQEMGAVLVFIPGYDLPDDLAGPCLTWRRETSSLAKLAWLGLPVDWFKGRNIWTVYRGVLVN
jgi:phosphatidylinositol glycan class B